VTLSEVDDLVDRFRIIRTHTEALAAPFSPEDQTVQSMPDVSPMKWHRAHTTWFFETFVLGVANNAYAPVDPSYSTLFNSYYVAVGPRYERAARGVISRPGSAEVAEYRHRVDEAMVDLLTTNDDPAITGVTILGLNHEQQHQELMAMDIKHVLSRNPLVNRRGTIDWSPAPTMAGSSSRFDGGLGWLGVDPATPFSFDNEGPRHQVFVAPFSIADRLTTNGDYLAFIDDGGYERADLWLSDGWAVAQAQGWEAPLYWERGESGWEEFTLLGRDALDGNRPVAHVSYYEADAFARWAEARLPTEAEWEVAVRMLGQGDDGRQGALHPTGVGDDHFGALWQWTQSAYAPYPGFQPAAGAVGEYNGKFMINNQVLRGSACVTPPGHSRPSYRNFFHPGARWMFSGIRLAGGVS
jgi:ergothioneine biosynthesis protein EgtB